MFRLNEPIRLPAASNDSALTIQHDAVPRAAISPRLICTPGA